MTTEFPIEEVIGFLLDTPMFEHLDEDELSKVVHVLELRKLPEGEVLFRAGDAGNAWYVVFEGSVEITHRAKDRSRVLTCLGPRGCFGEMAILDGSPRSAKVRATEPTSLLRIPRGPFNEMLRRGDLAAYKLVHRMALILAARIRLLNDTSSADSDSPMLDLTEDSCTDH